MMAGFPMSGRGEVMMPDQPVIMAVASYCSKVTAEQDFGALWVVPADVVTAPIVAAVVEKGADGRLTIDRYRSSADRPAWEGAVLGGLLTVLAAPLGISFLVGVVETGADLGGISAIAAHVWNHLPKDQLRRMSDLLESDQAALVVVAGGASGSLAEHAAVKVVAQTAADFDHDYSSGVEEARAIG
jgi:hypothetical protein